MVRVCDGKTLPQGDPAKFYLLRTFGGQGHEIWDVDRSGQVPMLHHAHQRGLKDTHKSWWECDTGIAYLVSGVAGWRVQRMTEVYDLSDPANPVKIRDFGLPGQQPGATGAIPDESARRDLDRPQGNRVYFGYGTNKGGVLQIVDRDKLLNGPKEPTPENLRYPVDRRARHVAVQRRAHDLPDAEDADRRVRQGQGGLDARHRDDRRRADRQRVQRAAPDGVVRRRHASRTSRW